MKISIKFGVPLIWYVIRGIKYHHEIYKIATMDHIAN